MDSLVEPAIRNCGTFCVAIAATATRLDLESNQK